MKNRRRNIRFILLVFSAVFIVSACQITSGDKTQRTKEETKEEYIPVLLEYKLLEDDTFAVSIKKRLSYNDDVSVIEIPEKYLDRQVTVIADEGFVNYGGMQKIVIPDTIRSIGYNAFLNCRALKNVEMGKNVRTILHSAFENCVSIDEIALSESLEDISETAFKGCTGLRRIIVPESVRTIGLEAFRGCTSIEEAAMGRGLQTIGQRAFDECEKLVTLRLNDGLKTIENSAFYGCRALKEFDFPRSVTEIAPDAFTMTAYWNALPDGPVYCHDLFYAIKGNKDDVTTIELAEGTKTIGKCAAYNYKNLRSVVLPSTVTKIDGAAFSACKELREIILPSSLESIGSYSFYNCENLYSLTLPHSVCSIGTNAFGGCKKIINFCFAGTKEEWDEITIESGTEIGVERVICSDGDRDV